VKIAQPLAEWGVKIDANIQWFYRDVHEPKDGWSEPPAGPGFGCELDDDTIERREEL
jgi:L-alanine-DL-glutamate epimerase-like enolase superfamily enzyme